MRRWWLTYGLAAPLLLGADRPPAEGDPALFGDLPRIEAASLHAQTLAEAPANVSVITAAEIRRYGYRTLGEALASVRGLYVTYDHIYHYVGVRGLSPAGDLNTRFLVMLNGHPLTENIYGSNNYFGQDFPIDMELVERIEIIRGPTSALYGSNGMLANVNVVTKSPVDSEKLRVALETGSFGERKATVASSVNFGHGANLLLSTSVINNQGATMALGDPRLQLPNGVRSPVNNVDGEKGYHTFANLIWREWSFTAMFGGRDKQPPVGWGSSLAGDSSQRVFDGRGLVSAAWRHRLGSGDLRWDFSYDRYRYHDHFDFPDGAGTDSTSRVSDLNFGDWLDSKLSYEFPTGNWGSLLVGLDAYWDLRNRQEVVSNDRLVNTINAAGHGVAVFAQEVWKVAPKLTLHAGVRVDDAVHYDPFVSPRLALVYQQSADTVFKLVYGRPFRHPSAYEQYFEDGGLSEIRAKPLRPETANTVELSAERRVAGNWTLVANAFRYEISDLIESVAIEGNVNQYQNEGRIRTTGFELELSGRLAGRAEASASSAWQVTRGDGVSGRLDNSPAMVSKLRLGVPLLGEKVWLAAAGQYLSSRTTWLDARVRPVAQADFTATWRLHPRCDLQAGLRNALDRRYQDPVNLTVDRMAGTGRSAYVRLVWRVWE